MQPHSVRRPPDMIVPVAAHIALNVPLDRNRPYPFLACLRASIANAGAGRKRSVAPASGGCRVPVSPIERAHGPTSHKCPHPPRFLRPGRTPSMSEYLVSHEPATGAELWRGRVSDVDTEIAAARAAWPGWAAKPFSYRTETLRRFVDRVKAEAEDFADLIARETGKPLWEARTEVESVCNKVDISVTAYAERTPNRRIEGAMGLRNAVRHKPHGTLSVLGPYNFPAHLPNGHIVPALLAGNSVLVKPSEKTPATGWELVELFHAAGVPEDVLRLIVGGPETGKALAAHDGLDGLLFTGSARTGLILNRQFAARPDKILALEMGGNNPVVVWDTADIRTAATLVVQSAFLSAGQRCTNPRRLIVKQAMAEPLIEEVRTLSGRRIVDHPNAEPEIGRAHV